MRAFLQMGLIGLGLVGLLVAGLAAYTAIVSARIAAAFPPRGSFVAIPGGRLHYLDKPAIGTERAVVLLLHGASGSGADMMLPLGDGLAARGFRVIAMDRPGLGWSDRPDGVADADPARQAALIRAGLDRLGVKGAIVVGHSLGGLASTALALDDPDLVRGLVLVAAVTHPWPGGGVDWYYRLASAPILGELFTRTITLPLGEAMLDAALKGVFAPQPVPPHYAARVGAARILRPETFRANAQDVAGAYAATLRQAPRLGEIAAPTAVVTGDHDGVVLTKLHSFGSARDIPGATLEVLNGVGHSPHWARPDAVIDAIDGVAKRAARAHAAAQ